MKELTRDDIFNLVSIKFKNAMAEVQAELSGRPEIYAAITTCSIETLSFAIATLIKNDYVDMETSMTMTIGDIKKTINSFLEAFAHFDNLN